MGTFGKRIGRMVAVFGLGELIVHLAAYVHLGLTTILVGLISIIATSSVKAKTNESRIGAIVGGLGTTNSNVTTQTGRINNLSGQSTGTGLPAGQPTGGPNGTGFFNTGGASAGTAHFHPLPNFPTAIHTHDFDGHTHNLPNV